MEMEFWKSLVFCSRCYLFKASVVFLVYEYHVDID